MEEPDVGEVQVVSAIANLSAVGILGYWLIFGLPSTLRQINEGHDKIVQQMIESNRRDREAGFASLEKMSESIHELAVGLQNICQATREVSHRVGNRPH